ncbi:MAG: Colicin V production protein [Limisphaerales bacterium]|nr:MAG: Colicin V production protein [Limisphaerales bacterium]KAG0510079.1 MAG: Colicin V production protein [Limisphaerales bacterium]TXT52922.1 MAG: Colicin V production protein [Limisphaerales bacterium]
MQVEVASWLNGLTPMFAAAAETATKAAAKAGETTAAGPSAGLFDVLLIIAIGLGCWRGKKRGISEELLDFLQWLVIIVAAGFLYAMVGDLLVQAKLPRLWANIGGYIAVMIVVSIIFGLIKKSVGNKMVESDFFGGWEYRLGMVAGAIRYLCIWIVVLAMLSARYFDAATVEAQRKLQEKEVGIVLIPSWGMLNRMAFYDSFTGPYIRQYLAHQLMQPVGLVKPPPSENTIGKQQQRVLDDVTSTPKPTPAPPPEKK